MRAGVVVACLIGAAFVLSGCQYLLGLGAFPVGGSDPGAFPSLDPGAFDSFDPGAEEPQPSAVVTYTKGTATITIAGKVSTLGRLTEGALYADTGAQTGWTDGKGMYLEFYGADPSATEDAYVQLDRIADGKHLATLDPSGCSITVKQADAHGLSGGASCVGLHWADTMSGINGFQPSDAPDGPPFDATITFQAAP
jgi:hypothetical protein